MASLENNSNFLKVQITIPTARKSDFVALMQRLLPVFTTKTPQDHTGNLTFGWTLMAGSHRQLPENGELTQLSHLWLVDPRDPWLTDVMGELSTSADYAKLDEFVVEEVQNFLRADRNFPIVRDPALWSRVGAVETLHVTGYPKKLDILETGGSLMTANWGIVALAAAAKAQGWTLLAQLTPVTGPLRQFVHFWAITGDNALSADAFLAWLQDRHEYREAVLSTEITVVEPIDYGAAAQSATSGG